MLCSRAGTKESESVVQVQNCPERVLFIILENRHPDPLTLCASLCTMLTVTHSKQIMETNMTIEELEAKREIAYASLDVLDEDAGYREMFYAYRQAFEHVDDALGDAIKRLKIHRDRDQNDMASRYG